MIRLNRDSKAAIVRNAVEKAGINTRGGALTKHRANWAEAVRLDALGGKAVEKRIKLLEKRFEKALADLPDGVRADELFRTDYDIMVNVAGLSFRAHFNGMRSHGGDDHIYRVTPASHTLKPKSPLVAEFHAIEQEQAGIDDAIDAIRAKVHGTLSRFNTVAQLLKAWPEAKELLPADIGAVVKAAQLPAVQTKDLNKLIGLPSESA